MKILRLLQNKIEPVEAIVDISKSTNGKDKSKSFVIYHGSFGTGLWNIKTYLHTRHFPPTNKGDKIRLDGNTYAFSAIHKDKHIAKDQKGNNIYIISKDSSYVDLNTIILFWNLPMFPTADVSYKIEGSARVLAEGTYGKFHIDNLITTPAPVVEISGKCSLTWIADDPRAGTITSQTIEYDPELDTWDIKPKEVVRKDI